jgi:hypothetical protein
MGFADRRRTPRAADPSELPNPDRPALTLPLPSPMVEGDKASDGVLRETW